MQFFQPTLHAPPLSPTLSGRTAIITGANTGIGLETARQLLLRRASPVTLAVRNPQKGAAARATLLADPAIAALDPPPTISVARLDMDDPGSIASFAAAIGSAHSRLDILVLNAGIGPVAFARSANTPHEQVLMVNFLAPVLLLLSLLPLLRAAAAATGGPARVTWTGSRAHRSGVPGLKSRVPEARLFEYMDAEENFSFVRYPDSKLLAVMFMYEWAARRSVAEGEVVFNMFCPGMVDTAITDVLPWWMRVPLGVVKALRARTAEEGGWVGCNAVAVVGEESHGKFLLDMDVVEEDEFVKSQEGKRLQKMLWEETVEEMKKYVDVPEWMEEISS
ncbi:Short-chain dehydrogenase/reductase SDR [Neofusicoccum parvum]|nr:Short-chain dehydrogenase/reductase SDR [Neofusicoccum parvum]